MITLLPVSDSRSSTKTYLLSIALLASTFLFSGCTTLRFLFQAGKGQLAISNQARPIEDVIQDEKTPPRIKDLLGEISSVKTFAEKNGLKATANYREYVAVDGPAVNWVVTACEPLRFEPKIWSFPLVGSFNYLGWFSKDDADEFAEGLRKQNLDVYVRGARAYSTLGWFNDPVLSTMIMDGEAAFGELVNVILHESVHATLYINGQSYFNESVADFIADELTTLYLQRKLSPDSSAYRAYFENVKKGSENGLKFKLAYEELDALYRSTLSDEEKRSRKTKVLTHLKDSLKAKIEINNATLIQFRTYGIGEDSFQKLFSACSKDIGRFLKALGGLSEDSFQKPQQEEFSSVLDKLRCN